MTIALARQIGRALDVKSESKIRAIDEAIRGYVRQVPQAGATPIGGTPTPGSKILTAVTVTGVSYTVTNADIIWVDDDTAGAEVTVTLPPAATAGARPRYIKKLGTTANVVIDGNGSETIDGGLTATLVLAQTCLEVFPDGNNWRIL